MLGPTTPAPKDHFGGGKIAFHQVSTSQEVVGGRCRWEEVDPLIRMSQEYLLCEPLSTKPSDSQNCCLKTVGIVL